MPPEHYTRVWTGPETGWTFAACVDCAWNRHGPCFTDIADAALMHTAHPEDG